MSPDDPANDLRSPRALLDEALLALRAVDDPSAPRREIEVALASSLRAVYRGLASGGDMDAFRAAVAEALEHARGALASLQLVPDISDSLAPITALVARSLGALSAARYDPEARAALPPLYDPRVVVPATLGAPALLALPRDALLPAVPLDELPPPEAPLPPEPADPEPVTSMEALQRFVASLPLLDAETGQPMRPDDEESTTRHFSLAPAEDPDARAADDERATFGEAHAYDDVVFDRARTCFEDLAMLGAMRRPLADEGWLTRARPEERLLARVDALAACGEAALPRLVHLHEDRPLPDPDLTWATAFLFGSLSGDDALDQVARTLAWTDLDAPAMTDCVADALAHAPHPGVSALLAPWVRDASPARRAVALAALARRGALDLEACVEALSDDDPRVLRAAARALLYVQGEVPMGAYARTFASDDEEVVRAGIQCSLLRDRDAGYAHAVALTRAGNGHVADAALYVAMVAPFEHREVFAEALGRARSPALYEALGWFGDPEFADGLLRGLDADDASLKASAALALQRISGAGLTDDAPDPRYAEGDLPFARAWREPEVVVDLSVDAAAWRAWWTKHGARATAQRRWRFGCAWHPRDELWELTHPGAVRRARVFAACALTRRVGVAFPLDLEGFVARQRAQLAPWQSAVRERNLDAVAGLWPSRVGDVA